MKTENGDSDAVWIDEFGGKYSADKAKLIKYDGINTSYEIREGTKVICDSAFHFCRNLTLITIPETTRFTDMTFGPNRYLGERTYGSRASSWDFSHL